MMLIHVKALRSNITNQLKNRTRPFQGTNLFCTAQDVSKERKKGEESLEYTQTIISKFIECKSHLSTAEVVKILEASTKQHQILPNILRLKVPKIVNLNDELIADSSVDSSTVTESEQEKEPYGTFSICGDTHGQFFDVMNIFKLGGFPSQDNVYLFNGDFVDRGEYSIEVILTLLQIKLSNPSAMHLLRGNHESIQMNKMFGFTKELMNKYPNDYNLLFGLFQEVFCSLPIAAVVDDQVFVTHGGLGPATSRMTLEELDNLNRFKEPEFDYEILRNKKQPGAYDMSTKEVAPGGMAELLWSDPTEHVPGFAQSERGGGTSNFGSDISSHFLDNNNLKIIVRSHQCMDEGFEIGHNGRCVTVFSAPDYCGSKNLGALLRFTHPEKMLAPNVIQFDAVPKLKRRN